MIEDFEFLLRAVVLMLVAPVIVWSAKSAVAFARGDYSARTAAWTFAFFASLISGMFTLRHLLALQENTPLILFLLSLKIVAAVVAIIWRIASVRERRRDACIRGKLQSASVRLREEIYDGN